jgi:hypothetical protein
MTASDSSGFGKFIPGFDFLQNLAKGAGAMPQLAQWVAPTLSVEELDKRIGELKNVQFWLEQNSRALAATVQALEVQKLTLATLKGMNLNIADMASRSAAASQAAAAAAAPATPEPATSPAAESASAEPAPPPDGAATASLVEPLKLWGALTQQFQQIAASALKEVGSGMAAAKAKPASERAPKSTAAATRASPGRVRKVATSGTGAKKTVSKKQPRTL